MKQRFRHSRKYKRKQLRKKIQLLSECVDQIFSVPITIFDKLRAAREILAPIEQLNFTGPTLHPDTFEDQIDQWSYMIGDEYEKAYLFNHRTKVLKGQISEKQILTEFNSMEEYYLYVDGRLKGTIPMQAYEQ